MLQVLVIDTGSGPHFTRVLRDDGYSVTCEPIAAANGRISAVEPDIIVVDLINGVDFQRFNTTVLQNVESQRVIYLLLVTPGDLAAVGSSSYTGDFMIIPAGTFPTEELLARVRRIVRTRISHKASEAIAIDGLVIDQEAYEVRADGELVELTYQEFLLLTFLTANRGKAYSRQQLLDRVWGFNYFGGTRTVDIHVRRIRAKLGPRYNRYIQTVRQVGYKFVGEVRA
ncbi:MAG: transcriptional regulator [Myxococcales bacterium]|nr:transcriptional regulator [Myxococcales bacterium]|tara:strand:- start:86 stop:766 length:681 start_codon:yes stop_codon:yes gene_type:complete